MPWFTFGDDDFVGSVDFSPDGKFYARVEGDYGLVLMDFDRCSGRLSNPITLDFPNDDPYFTAIGFSPNSQYLYLTTRYNVWQFDLEDKDIQESLILAGQVPEELHGMPGTSSLYLQQIGPDSKIYVAGPLSHDYLSTIDNPSATGAACDFRPYSIELPKPFSNYGGLPNHPHFRLGPIDGSVCDTLGIDNVPVAYFRYDTSQTDPLHIDFRDLSYFEPAAWLWDFGDDTESGERHPEHMYTTPGVYEVCLQVENVNGSDTFCRTLDLMTTAVGEFTPVPEIVVYPNPAFETIHLQGLPPTPGSLHFHLLDVQGRTVQGGILTGDIRLGDEIRPGLYLLEITDGQGRVHVVRKVVVK